MGKHYPIKKGLVVAVIFLFAGMSVIPSIGTTVVNNSSMTAFYDGSLSGYVNDISMNPIEGALVRVYFHGTYEENYSDSNGYYHVTNIPICWCYKNCTASKEGYETEWVWLSIYENTTYNFVLTPLTQYDGSLSGYVNNTLMNPIEEARVRVHFHGTYEEDYTDSSGYYHVTNIPICYCLKNCTASKEGYETEWILLSITENTTHDFVLTPLDPVPDLECNGYLDWTVRPGDTATGEFTVRNIGDPGSLLDWEITEWPEFGGWFVDPICGDNLKPEDGPVTVHASVTAPDMEWAYCYGFIEIVNKNNYSDSDLISVDLFTTSWMTIEKPTKCIYINNEKIIPFIVPVIIGKINIEISTSSIIDMVEFYVDGRLQHVDTISPFDWAWDKIKFFRHTLKIIIYKDNRTIDVNELIVWKFF